MQRAVRALAAAGLLGAPTVLAFFSGGYFAEPRLVAAIVAWALVLAMTVVGVVPLPRSGPGWLAVGGLAALAGWSAISIAWAPLAGPALDSVERLLLYLGALLLAIGALRTPALIRAVEPALAAGIAIVIGYGLAGRLLPGIFELAASLSADGRLEQPITYWNAEGALAAVGLLLCARIAGDPSRPTAARVAAAAAVPPLGMGIYLSYSRGAIAVAVLGLITLVALAPTRAQLHAAAVTAVGGALAAAAAAPFDAVAALEGSSSERTREGLLVLAALVAISAVTALVTARRATRDRSAGDRPLPRPRALRAVAAAAVVAVALGLVVGGLGEKPSEAELALGAKAERLTSAASNRYEYWHVGLAAFGRRPLQGVGAGGFRVEWLRERSIPEVVRDTHSLEVELAAELGLVGLLAFGVMLAGVAGAARRALRAHPRVAAGWCAALIAWILHASIDWDWQLPAVTLPAIVLAGALIALAEAAGSASAGSEWVETPLRG